jgi:hypothetical protein
MLFPAPRLGDFRSVFLPKAVPFHGKIERESHGAMQVGTRGRYECAIQRSPGAESFFGLIVVACEVAIGASIEDSPWLKLKCAHRFDRA